MHPPLDCPLEDPIPQLPPEGVLSIQDRYKAFGDIADSILCLLRGWAETNGLPEAGKPFTITVTDPKWFVYAYHAMHGASDYFSLEASKNEPGNPTTEAEGTSGSTASGPPDEDPEIWLVVLPEHNVNTMVDDMIFVTGHLTLTTDPFQAKWCTTYAEANSFRVEASVSLVQKTNIAAAAKLTIIKTKVSEFLEKTK